MTVARERGPAATSRADVPATPAAFPPALRAELDHLFEHLNDGHGDTVLLIASLAQDGATLREADLASADPTGIALRATRADGTAVDLHLPFTGSPDTLLGVRAELFDMLRRARERADETQPLTSLERELAQTARLPTFVSTVARTADLTPHLKQLTVRGGLEDFVPIAPDQFLYAMVDRPGRIPGVIASGFRMEDLQRLPETERPAAAYYTVRRFDPATGEMDLWFVLHDHDAGVSAWASTARPGDRIALWGPRTSFTPPEPCRSLLLVGDDTALPAIAAILEQRAPTTRIQVVLETADAEHVVELPRGPEVSLCWVFRGTTAPGTSGRLLDAVRELALPDDLDYAFGAGENGEIAAVRRHLRRERGLPAERVRMVAYWRRVPPHP